MTYLIELFNLTIIIIIGILLRLIQFARFKIPGSSDVFFHLVYMRNINEFFKNIQPYPYFFHLLSGKVKEIFRLSDDKLILIGAIPDAITGLVAYFILRNYFGTVTSLIALALFLTTPYLVYQSVFGPRSLGLLMYTSSLLALIMPFPLNAFSILFVSLTALTHKLSLQTLFFIVLLYGFFFDAIGILYFILGFLLAIIISRMKYLRVFRFHLSYLKLMMTKSQYRYPNREYLAFIEVPYATIVPLWLAFSIARGMHVYNSIPCLNQLIGRFFLMWGAATFALVFLWRWGDSHRYVSFSSLPLAMLFSDASISNDLLRLLLPIFLSGNVILSLYITRRNTLITENFLQAVKFLSEILEDGFLCPEEYYWTVKYFTKGKGAYIKKGSIVKPPYEETDQLKHVIIPISMMDDVELNNRIRVLFSNEEWIVGEIKSKINLHTSAGQ